MLYAVIRSERDAFHFFGEVSGYNLQTVRQHVRGTAADGGPVHVRFEIEPKDQAAFERHARRWLAALGAKGTVVEVEVVPAPGQVRVTSGVRPPGAAAA